MKSLGELAAFANGWKYALDDIHPEAVGRMRGNRRKRHKRIYKKIGRKYLKRELRKEIQSLD